MIFTAGLTSLVAGTMLASYAALFIAARRMSSQQRTMNNRDLRDGDLVPVRIRIED